RFMSARNGKRGRLPIGAGYRRFARGDRLAIGEIGMRRAFGTTALATIALSILAPAAVILAGPDAPWVPPVADLAPYAALGHTVDCRPGGKTVAIAWGKYGTAIGLYVY